VPNILLAIMIALPFIDVRRERRLYRRPVAIVPAIVVVLAMGKLNNNGATAKESLGSETIQEVPKWAEEQGFADDPEAVAGAKLFAVAGCLQCHTYLGSGSSNLGAPDLSDIGSTGQSVAHFQAYITNPAQFGNTLMPPFAALGQDNLHKIAVFLEASKGPKG
jgi:mono/diheme cytochrome c family protein